MAFSGAKQHKRGSSILAVLVIALLASSALFSVNSAFTGTPVAARRSSPRMTMRYNIFEGLPSFDFDQAGDEPGNDRAARRVNDADVRLVEVGMPLGMDFEEKEEGNIYISGVDPSSDAYAQGVRPGAQVTMVSATFGDEMWNAKNVGMTQFTTVVKSRFGSTMQLALAKEDRSLLDQLFGSIAPQQTAEQEAKIKKDLAAEFDKEESKLQGKFFGLF